MSLNFWKLDYINSHQEVIHTLFPNQKLFIVWWTVRDLLLWRTDSPTDIDLTCYSDPDPIRETMQFNETTMSRFRTEKFGTITVIPKNKDWSSSEINYELTPFRAESDYTNNRHPDEIEWSDSLVSDSARRDFTINALYRTSHTQTLTTTHFQSSTKKDALVVALKKHLPVVIATSGLVILTDSTHIQIYITKNILPATLYGLEETETTYTASKENSTVCIHQIILDPQWWLLDLIARKVKTVWDPATRYQEDALRLMRGLRFINTLNQWLTDSTKQNSWFDFEKRTREQLVANSELITNVASERHHQELWKVFQAHNPFWYIANLKTAWMLQFLFPALSETINNHQPTRHHALDTYSHTLMVLYHLQQRVEDPLVRFATLYHDVWKPEQYDFMERAKEINPENPNREGFEHHAEISVRLAAIDFKKLSFPKTHIEKICRYIKRHHRPWEILDSNIKKRDQKIRKLMSEWWVQETLWLIDIAIADRLWQYNPIQSPAIQELLDMQDRVRELFESEWRFTKKDLAIHGKWVMQKFELKPWPQIWEVIDRTFEWVLWDVKERNTKRQIEAFVKGIL